MARTKKGFQPMLACKAPDNLADVELPIWASRKLDGIRCVIRNRVPLSRTLKPIQNKHIRDTLIKLDLPSLDGELMLADPLAPFSEVTSAVMSRDGCPDFRYHVFDLPATPADESPLPQYWRRYAATKVTVQRVGQPLVLVKHWLIRNLDELEQDEAAVVAEGFEGLMLRGVGSPYKFGRSTLHEGYLMKVKRFLDSEAEVIGMVELMRNENELESNEVGYAKRSTAQSGLVPAGTMGALVCRWYPGPVMVLDFDAESATTRQRDPVDFEIGTGFDAKTRAKLWACLDQVVGRHVKFKYQDVGAKGRPRFPVYLGFRDAEDQSS